MRSKPHKQHIKSGKILPQGIQFKNQSFNIRYGTPRKYLGSYSTSDEAIAVLEACKNDPDFLKKTLEKVGGFENKSKGSKKMVYTKHIKSGKILPQGIRFDRNKYNVRVRTSEKVYHLGRYETAEEAIRALDEYNLDPSKLIVDKKKKDCNDKQLPSGITFTRRKYHVAFKSKYVGVFKTIEEAILSLAAYKSGLTS